MSPPPSAIHTRDRRPTLCVLEGCAARAHALPKNVRPLRRGTPLPSLDHLESHPVTFASQGGESRPTAVRLFTNCGDRRSLKRGRRVADEDRLETGLVEAASDFAEQGSGVHAPKYTGSHETRTSEVARRGISSDRHRWPVDSG
jgi:hypothetical protein